MNPRTIAQTTHFQLLGSGNGDDIVPLRKNPSKCDLPSGGSMLGPDPLESIGNLEDVGEILRAVPVRMEVVSVLTLTRKELSSSDLGIIRLKSVSSRSSVDF